REGPAGDPRRGEERHRDHAGALVRPGAGARSRAQARAARRCAGGAAAALYGSAAAGGQALGAQTPHFVAREPPPRGGFSSWLSSLRKSSLAAAVIGRRMVPACNKTFRIKERAGFAPAVQFPRRQRCTRAFAFAGALALAAPAFAAAPQPIYVQFSGPPRELCTSPTHCFFRARMSASSPCTATRITSITSA